MTTKEGVKYKTPKLGSKDMRKKMTARLREYDKARFKTLGR